MIKFTDKLPFACVRFIVKYIKENIENFNTRLISRGYPEQMEVIYKDRKEALKQKSKIAEKELLPFVSGNFTQSSIFLQVMTIQVYSKLLLPYCTTSRCNPAITSSVQYCPCSNLRILKCRNLLFFSVK